MQYTLEEHKSKKLILSDVISENVMVAGKINQESINKLEESAKGKSKRKLIVQMEAIHVGRTANYTFYTEQGLKDGIESWTHPYNKPVLTHHDAHNGEPVGRILKAEFAESTMSGRKGLIFTCEITDPQAMEKVLDGRYSTVSIGATTDKVTCNICGTDRTKEWCEHWRGEEYEGQTCHFTIGTTMGREVSYVNVPADEHAGNFSVTVEDDTEEETNESSTLKIFQIAEGLMQDITMPEVNLYESAGDDIKGLVDGLLETKEGSVQTKMKYTLNESGQIVDESGAVLNIEEMVKAKADFDEAQKQIKDLEKDLNEAKSTLSDTVIEKTKIESDLKEKETEIQSLTEANAELIEKSHKALAEKVVDMKLSLRKKDVVGVDREEAVEEHIKRSEDSLKDAIKDLQAEMEDTTAVRGVVKNPGAGGEDNNPAKTDESEESKKPTVEEALGMFKGMFSRK